jgi:hypothetical protein
MMQPSDLDRKILPLSPNTKKQNRASDPTVKNHLSAVPKSTNSQEHPTQDVCENVLNSSTSSSPKTELSQESAALVNGNGRSLSAVTGSEPESPKLDGSGVKNGGQQGFLPVLKNPNFLALWGGQVFCQMADKVYLC